MTNQGQTKPSLRVRSTAAARIGVTLAEYDQRREAGEKWCCGCKAWHPCDDFARDSSRGDGRVKWCRSYTSQHSRSRYTPRPRPTAGRRFVEARDDDRHQARRRVNHLVDVGLLPRANDLPCTDCGHVHVDGERRHEYDHYLGYDATHHEDVQSVCTKCHNRRERNRRAA